MGTTADSTTLSQILKDVWEDDIYSFMFDQQPFFGLVGKKEDWSGDLDHVVIRFGGMNGVSAGFAEAQAAAGPSKMARMDVESRDLYGIVNIGHKLITQSRNDKGALVRALADQSEQILDRIKLKACQSFWRNGGGAQGKISAITGSTFTLVDKNDIRNYSVGDSLSLAVDDGTGGAGVEAGAALEVSGLDEDTGIVTCTTGIVATVATAAVGDFVFATGAYNALFSGVPAYVTLATPGTGGIPASIWNMDRTPYPQFLAGSRFTGTVSSVLSSITNALAAAHRRRIKVTHLFTSPEVYAAIETALQLGKRYVEEKATHGLVGFKALEFTTQGGQTVKVYSDADIAKSPDGATSYVYGLNLDTWTFSTMDAFPMDLGSIAGASKNMLLATENASQYRIGGYGNLYTKAPGQNFVLALT